MKVPLFGPDHDPGSSFTALLRAVGVDPFAAVEGVPRVDLAPHATTVLAVKFRDGVVMAGDRRATLGNLIAQKDIEKVFAVGNSGTRIGRIVSIRKGHCSSRLFAFRELCSTKGNEVAYAS